MIHQERENQKGFTLVELIVVITILSLMAGILVPQLLGHVDKARMDAEYDSGENCRLAAQLKLNALEYMDVFPNRDSMNREENTAAGAMWSPDFREDVIAMSGVDVYNLYIGTGQFATYNTNAVTEDDSYAYTVYFVAYQRDENSPMVFYDGEKWGTKCPWSLGDTTVPTLNVGGSYKKIQFFCLKYNSPAGETSEQFFSGLEEAYAE